MTEVSCYSCGSARHAPYATENGWRLVKCAGCGLLYVNPRPNDDEIKESVTIGAHTGEQTLSSTGKYMPAKVATCRKVLTDIYGSELQTRKWAWLDVGSGHGEMLVALRELSRNNVTAKGMEPNRYRIAAARKRGLDVDDFDLASHGQNYDCISLLNVYSHLPNPPSYLRLVRQRLKPKGEVLLQTGDTAGFRADQHPRPFLLPDHLSFCSEEILLRILKETGFKIISISKYPVLQIWLMRQMVLKEFAKVFLPHKKSQLGSLYSMIRVGQYRTNMWVRARVAA